MQKKFEINWTKIKGGCQSGRKVVTHNLKSDLPLAHSHLQTWGQILLILWLFIFIEGHFKNDIGYKKRGVAYVEMCTTSFDNIFVYFNDKLLKKILTGTNNPSRCNKQFGHCTSKNVVFFQWYIHTIIFANCFIAHDFTFFLIPK